jgi:hypothetical protein
MIIAKKTKNLINTETKKHDGYEKWEMLNNIDLFLIKNEQTETNLIAFIYY